MIDVRRQEDHFHHERSWLKTDWHFSFSHYRDPDNMNFGPLRVVNNDWIDGGGGFPTHSHDNMEIITWVIEGSLVHEDSTGSTETIGRGGVQTMSAGTGISHSEYNASQSDRLHLIQVWIEPEEHGVDPRYEDQEFTDDQLEDRWTPIASGREDAATSIHQDATMFVRHAEDGDRFEYGLEPERRGYLVVMDGAVSLNDSSLTEGDAGRIKNESTLTFEVEGSAELMLMDLP
ncbi:MAG: pirin family protein [bacterium]